MNKRDNKNEREKIDKHKKKKSEEIKRKMEE